VLHSVVFADGSQCGAVSRAGTPDEGLARGVMRPGLAHP